MESPPNIRPAKADVHSMLEIYAPIVLETAISFELEPPTVDEFKERLRQVQKRDPWLVLEDRDQITGFAYATDFRSRPAYLSSRETTVYVHPDHRGRGVGGGLMSALLAELRSRDVRLVVAGITLPNEGSVALHQRLGFRHVGTFHEAGRKFDRWHDLGFWELLLGG